MLPMPLLCNNMSTTEAICWKSSEWTRVMLHTYLSEIEDSICTYSVHGVDGPAERVDLLVRVSYQYLTLALSQQYICDSCNTYTYMYISTLVTLQDYVTEKYSYPNVMLRDIYIELLCNRLKYGIGH